MITGQAGHVWHVWINSESEHFGEKQSVMPIEPHRRKLYDFKSALSTLPWLARAIGLERKKSLPLVHQQCSFSTPEPMKENYLMCSLGKKLIECPILNRLRQKFAEYRVKDYYQKITDEEVDEVMAATCVWHMLMGSDSYTDWNEGAVQDCSDRMFWNRVYESMSLSESGGES